MADKVHRCEQFVFLGRKAFSQSLHLTGRSGKEHRHAVLQDLSGMDHGRGHLAFHVFGTEHGLYALPGYSPRMLHFKTVGEYRAKDHGPFRVFFMRQE